MKKFFSLLKAVMSQDMNIFVYKAKKNSSNANKLLVPIILSLVVMFSIGAIYYPLALELSKENLTYVVLSVAVALPSIIAIIEGVYKSQGILFEAKDGDLLFSLPIPKKNVLLARITKLYTFQFLYSLLFVIPGIFLYAIYEKPETYFYFITAIMLVLLPIIPTIIGCAIGYVIQKFSVRFKTKKIVQTLITIGLILVIMAFSFNSQDLINSLITNAKTVNDTLCTVYLPIGAYINLIKEFNILELLKIIAINAIPVALFVFLASKSYFKVHSKSTEHTSYKKAALINISELNFKPKNKLWSLIQKEFARYFSSTVYMINTLFGLVLLIIATVSLCTNFNSSITAVSASEINIEDINLLFTLAPKLFLGIIVAMSFMTSITSSSISIEGKTFNISKSLPINTEEIFLAKILMSNIITIPVVLICDIIFFCNFSTGPIDAITILISSFVAPSIAATLGLIVNLKYPKMDASSDSEVVKQSMSSMVSVFGGIILAAIFGILTFVLAGFGDFAIIFEAILLLLVLAILIFILKTYGNKRFKEIEI